MKKINNILIEIGTEELPYKNLHILSNNFKKTIKENLINSKIKIQHFKNFVTLRRIAFKITTINISIDDINEKIKNLIDKSINNLKLNIKMRWGIYTEQFIRPVKWFIFLINNVVINHKIFNIKSDNKSLTHKNTNKYICVDYNTYEKKLKIKGHVICDHIKRKQIITNLIKKFSKKNNINIILKRTSIQELTNLTEYPSLIECKFNKFFLKLPEEILINSLFKNNFCFLIKKNNKLTNKVLIIIDSFKKNKEIIHDYTYIINTKLSELEYLYLSQKNLIHSLKISNLKKINLNEHLGNMYTKTMRLEKLINYVLKNLNIKNKNIISATKYLKLDMLTKIVYEMPELTGLIYAYIAHINLKIKQYMFDYNKIINNQKIKSKNASIIVLIDKIDHITSFFILNKKPTGSKDPFNLKKDAKLINNIIFKNRINLNIQELISYNISLYKNVNKNLKEEILNFIKQKIETKIDYITALNENENIFKIILFSNIIKNLNLYKFKDSITNIIKRIAKITSKNRISLKNKLNTSYLIKSEEKILFKKIKNNIKIINILKKNNMLFEESKYYLILEKSIITFFEKVLVLEKNESIKNNRLKLLNIIKKIMLNNINYHIL